jgi:CheY-like chemotaxis protein
MTTPWGPDDPRLRRKAVPGESSIDRVYRLMAEGPKRRSWADRVLRPEPEPQPPAFPEEETPQSPPSGDIGNASRPGTNRDKWRRTRDYKDRGDGFAPTTFAEIEAADRERRADQRAEAVQQDEVHGTRQHDVHGVRVGKRGHVLAGLNPRSRKPGGRFRAGQRAPGRNPPAPRIPVFPTMIEQVLLRPWRTPGGWVNLFRRRALAAISVALALPPESSIMTKLCELRYHDLVMLDLRMPEIGWRHVIAWLRARQDMLGDAVAFNTSWLAIPPGTNGRPRMIGWAMTQTLHRGGAPAWRSRELVRASWSPYVTTTSWAAASCLRPA